MKSCHCFSNPILNYTMYLKEQSFFVLAENATDNSSNGYKHHDHSNELEIESSNNVLKFHEIGDDRLLKYKVQ